MAQGNNEMHSSIYPIQFRDVGQAVCGEYVRTEVIDDLQMPNLNNALHIIFREQNFSRDFPVDRVKIALQLCTKLLESDAALSWFYTVFESRGRHMGYYGRQRVQTWEYVDDFRKTVLTVEQKDHTRLLLLQLARVTKFHVAAPDAPGHETQVHWNGPSTPHTKFPRWVDIIMSMRQLHNAERSDDPIYKLHCYFDLACAFMHELAHAATSCRTREMWFFPGENMSEEGFALEAQLFGGCFDLWSFGPMEGRAPGTNIPYYASNGKQSKMDFMIVLKDWPNPSKCMQYLDEDCHFGHYGEIRKTTFHWNVRIAHIAQLFQDEYWMRVGSGFNATRFPKTTGIVMHVDRHGNAITETPRAVRQLTEALTESPTHEFVVKHTAEDGVIHMIVPRNRMAPLLPKLVTLHDMKEALRGKRIPETQFLEMVKDHVQGRWDEFQAMMSHVAVVDITPGKGRFVSLRPGL